MNTKIFLYDAEGCDKELNFEDINLEGLNDRHLLWINILERDEKTIRQITDKLQIKDAPIKSLINTTERPKLDKFEDFYRFFIISVDAQENKNLRKIPIDFLVGEKFVVTVQEKEVEYFREFREREKGETQIGKLDAESFVATLLDLHIVTYFKAVELVEKKVDDLDEEILTDDPQFDDFLKQMVKLRGDVSKLRRWLLPHRDVFYPLTRPDFFTSTDNDAIEHFKLLNEHFETAIDSIESSRDTVISLLDLYATKSSERMNQLMHKLTFITLLVGSLGVIAGILGMNFKLDFFESENGFWQALLMMIGFALLVASLARWKKWF